MAWKRASFLSRGVRSIEATSAKKGSSTRSLSVWACEKTSNSREAEIVTLKISFAEWVPRLLALSWPEPKPIARRDKDTTGR